MPDTLPQLDAAAATGAPKGTHRDTDLDALDAELIRRLQADGRTSVNDLAAQLGGSRTFIAHRLKHLLQDGGLRIVAALDPRFAGHHVLVHVKAEVDGPVKHPASAVATMPDSVFVSRVSGEFPLVFESRHRDVGELHRMLNEVHKVPGIRRVSVSTYAEILKGFFVSNSKKKVTLDGLDFKLVAILQQDGRTSFRSLADTVHLSPSSVRARVNRLIDLGAIRISATKSGGISRSRLAVGVGITTSDDPDSVRTHIIQSPDIDFAARAHGRYDFIATLVGASASHLLDVIDEIRSLTSVSSVDTWTHFDIIKEDYARTLGKVLPQQLIDDESEGELP